MLKHIFDSVLHRIMCLNFSEAQRAEKATLGAGGDDDDGEEEDEDEDEDEDDDEDDSQADLEEPGTQ